MAPRGGAVKQRGVAASREVQTKYTLTTILNAVFALVRTGRRSAERASKSDGLANSSALGHIAGSYSGDVPRSAVRNATTARDSDAVMQWCSNIVW